MNAKEIAERMLETSWNAPDWYDNGVTVAKAYLAQEAKIQGLVDAVEYWAQPHQPGSEEFGRAQAALMQALTAYKEGK